jgi:hypothetical protein
MVSTEMEPKLIAEITISSVARPMDGLGDFIG